VTNTGMEVGSPRPESRLAQAVEARVGSQRFHLWFDGHARFVLLGGEVVVVARNPQCQDWLEHAFSEDVKAAAVEVLGAGTTVRWVVDGAMFGEVPAPPTNRGEQNPESTAPSPATRDADESTTRLSVGSDSRTAEAKRPVDLFGEPLPAPRAKKPRPEDKEAESFARSTSPRATRRWRTLADFIVGPSNRVAHAAALSAVEEPGCGANPLVIHGPVGTGKTHLLEGIYLGLRKHNADMRPCFATAEDFTNRFVQAMRLGKMAAFRRQYRDCSALFLDDLHFLATRRATQEEFLHTLDSLASDGRQVVVTTDCHPRLADELMPELTDRLLGGAVWNLLPPDPDTRLEILRHKSRHAQPAIPDDVLKCIAACLRGNVRELEGALNCLRHYSRVTGRPVDMSAVKEALGDLLRHAIRVVTIADVDAAVCNVLRLPQGTLQSRGRSWAVSHPRMIATFLCRKHTAATYGEISKFFASRTHSTAVSSEKKVRTWIDRDTSIAIGDREWRAKDIIDRIEREIMR